MAADRFMLKREGTSIPGVPGRRENGALRSAMIMPMPMRV